jgi:hypothetical protein
MMTQAVVTRRDGDVFQARMFWLKAARLLDDEGTITKVGFESGPRGFDDIWVEYDPSRAPKNQFGVPFPVERMQCKWHATGGNYTYKDLINPEFINAEKTSMLQRAYAALNHDRQHGITSRLALITNHRTDDKDPLHGLVRMKSFNLSIDQLFSGTTARSATFKVRREWMDHLGINEMELRELCVCLGLVHTSESLDMLRERLDDACRLAGLVRPDPRSSTTIYDGNIFEWVGQRRMEFDRKTFREKCGDEGLLTAHAGPSRTYGVKSFEHAFDRLEDSCHDVLNFVSEFDDRFVVDASAWQKSLQPQLKAFLLGLTASDGRLRLAMDAHASLAFAAGAVLDTKSGRVVEVVQRSPSPVVWAPDDQLVSPSWPTWEFQEVVINPDGHGSACSVSISRDTEPSVRLYASQNLPSLRRLLVARLNAPISQTVVVSGSHANRLAETLAERIKSDRESDAKLLMEHLHLFVAAPNAFTFFLGRHVQVLKPVTLYEFDFARERSGSYEPSLSYPPVKAQ